MAIKAHRELWLQRLDPVEYERDNEADSDQLEQMTLAGVLLTLSGINHEREYELSRKVAEHLLGNVYEPEDIQVD